MKKYEGNWICVLGILIIGFAVFFNIIVFTSPRIGDEVLCFICAIWCYIIGSYLIMNNYDFIYSRDPIFTVYYPEIKDFKKQKYNWKSHFMENKK